MAIISNAEKVLLAKLAPRFKCAGDMTRALESSLGRKIEGKEASMVAHVWRNSHNIKNLEKYAKIGNYNLLTSYCFISHDCVVGDNNFFSIAGIAGSRAGTDRVERKRAASLALDGQSSRRQLAGARPRRIHLGERGWQRHPVSRR